MGRNRIEAQEPDLFSGPEGDFPSLKQASGATAKRTTRRTILPNDLPTAVRYLDDRELDRLLLAVTNEARRRGRLPPTPDTGHPKIGASRPAGGGTRQKSARTPTVPLTQGQVNAVRAAFRAGITPTRIARQFGLSQSDVRKALASDETKE